MRKVLLTILGIILLIPGLGNLARAIMLKSQNPQLASQYSNVVSGQLGFGIVFITISIILFVTASKSSNSKKTQP